MRLQPASTLRHFFGAGRVAAVLGLLLVAVTGTVGPSMAGPAQPPVTGGGGDGTDHPYVAMVIRPGSSSPSCTGVLVQADNGSPVVLTDAHCLYRGRHTGSGVRVTFVPDFTSTAPTFSGTFSVDPGYDARTHLHDVAVITLSRSAGINPAHLAPLESVSRIMINSYVDTVGMGKPHWGHRRAATERVTRRSAAWIYLVPGNGNTCSGDSGGPDLIRGTSTVVALTNQGTCAYDQDTRLETTIGSRSFIDRAAGLPGPRPTIRYGSKGTDVKVVQNLLGLSPGGTFGPRTKAAVMSWQRGHRLSASGVVGPKTWHSLGF
ncbi:MAG: trypsin-like serine protease [Actinomycetota bacterium]|nr:trypsin-like serine protease [Actinomycetota bacterium]